MKKVVRAKCNFYLKSRHCSDLVQSSYLGIPKNCSPQDVFTFSITHNLLYHVIINILDFGCFILNFHCAKVTNNASNVASTPHVVARKRGILKKNFFKTPKRPYKISHTSSHLGANKEIDVGGLSNNNIDVHGIVGI